MDHSLHELKQELQAFFADGLVTLVGAGLSAAEGLPGTNALALHLRESIDPRTFTPESESTWARIAQSLTDGADLESVLQETPPTAELESTIRSLTASLIRAGESKVLTQTVQEDRRLRLQRLVPHLVHSGGHPATIITTNYDRLVEFACESAGLAVNTLFIGSTSGTLAPEISKWPACRGALLRQRPRQPAFKWANQAEVLKPHGSLDWFSYRNFPNRISLPLDVPPMIITPGHNKYLAGYEQPFDAHRERANRRIDRSSRYLTIGYGFNDYHLQTHLEPELASGKPLLLITRSLSDRARSMITYSSKSISLSAPDDAPYSGTIVTRADDQYYVDGLALWDIETLATEVLEP